MTIIYFSYFPRGYVPRHSTAFHFVRQFNILGVNVKLPLPLAQNTGQNGSRVYAHSHVYRRICRLLYVSNMAKKLKNLKTYQCGHTDYAVGIHAEIVVLT
jgi:hypothetical protein